MALVLIKGLSADLAWGRDARRRTTETSRSWVGQRSPAGGALHLELLREREQDRHAHTTIKLCPRREGSNAYHPLLQTVLVEDVIAGRNHVIPSARVDHAHANHALLRRE